jgi:hypothetical protein
MKILKGKVFEMDNAINARTERCNEHPMLKLKKSAFTRDRKLGAKRLVMILLRRVYMPLQLTIDKFFKHMGCQSVSKQAVSQARALINPEFIRGYVDDVTQIAATDPTTPKYKGMTLIAIDGTDIALENSPELVREYGCSGPDKNAATALASVAFGPLDHFIYDCRIDRYDKDERDLAKQHIDRLLELGMGNSLLLFDRWYPSAEFIGYVLEKGFSFVMRVRRKWSLEADAVKTQGKISVMHGGLTHSVRVLKIRLNTGEVETLLTNLPQKQLPIREAGALYFKRWGVETGYDALKSKLQMENFSGKTKVAVEQDFYATVFLLNMASAHASIANDEIAGSDACKQLKYPRKASLNRSISKLRDCFWEMLAEQDREKRQAISENIILEIARYPVSIVPNRSPARKKPRKKRFYVARKAVVS